MPEEIMIDTETWGTRELLEVIASRFFELGNEGAHPNSWEVRGLDGEEPSGQLIQLNEHLDTMGLVGSLEDTNPPILTISRIPLGSSMMEGYQQALLWLVMAVFVTMVGSHWVSEFGYSENSTALSHAMESLLFFTLPVIVTLGIASFCRVLIARKFGVEIGHISPVVFPIPTWWPFGIVGTLGQRKLDLVPLQTRLALGSIELVVPLILFLSGSALTVVGLVITPGSPPLLNGPPTIFETNLLAGTLAESWMGEQLDIRLQWLHPIGISGVGLSLVGWVMMLPIPGLPGDRLLHAIVGPSEMRKGGMQTSIFLLVLFAMVLVFATAKWTPWVFLAFVAAWQRFNPDSLPQPIVLDEHAGLEERFKSRFVSIACVILLAGLPGSVPAYEMEDYIAGITTEGWVQEIEFSGDSENVLLTLEPEGIMPVSGWLQMRIEGAQSDKWGLSHTCSEIIEVCRFDDVTQSDKHEVSVTITPPEQNFSRHLLKIFVEVSGFEMEHSIVLSNVMNEGLIGPFWELYGEVEKPIICTQVIAGEGDEVLVESSYWEPINSSNLSSGIQEVCLEGHYGAIQSSENFDSEGRAFGPEVFLRKDNSTSGPWIMAIEDSMESIQVKGGMWGIPVGFASVEDVLFHSDYGSPFCPTSEVVAQVDTGGNWSVEMGNYSTVRLMGNLSGNGSIGIGEEGWLAVCGSDGSMKSFRIKEGVDVYSHQNGLGRGIVAGNFSIINRESEGMPLSLEWHGDSPHSGIWNVDIAEWAEPGDEVIIEAKSSGNYNLERAVWITADEAGIIVHLSARCPVEGC